MPFYLVRNSSASKRNRESGADMRDAYLRALAHQVEACPSGTIILPTGPADAAEVARVLRAIERAQAK
jgi:hypothetical protein